MKWKTNISHIKNGKEELRGKNLLEIAKTWSFSKTIYFLLKGTEPKDNEVAMMDALLSVAIDHGIGTPSTMTTRIVTSTKNSMHTAVAAGILAMGERHGSAIEGAARFFQEHADEDDIETLIKQLKEHNVRIPGFGHKVLEHDYRSDMLFDVAREQKIYGKYCKVAEQIGEELNKVSSKKLPLNIDGSMGAIISDLGFDWKLAKGFFIIARVPGLVAHSYEEMIEDGGVRRLDVGV